MSFNHLRSYIGKNLRYVSLGWTRYHPFANLLESHSINATNYDSSPADIFLEFGDDLNDILRIRCKCFEIQMLDLYRFELDQFNDHTKIPKSSNSINVGETIEEIQIYETYIDIEDLNFCNYVPNGILVKFKQNRFLVLFGTEGDEQYEPCIYLGSAEKFRCA